MSGIPRLSTAALAVLSLIVFVRSMFGHAYPPEELGLFIGVIGMRVAAAEWEWRK